MSSDFLGDRRRGLEEAFFHERDRQLLEKLQGELSALEEKHKLAHVSGILDESVLRGLVEAGVQAETLLATRLIPLVVVAWADGKVTPEEREAVLKAATSEDYAIGSAAYQLVESWLDRQPDERIFHAWREYNMAAVKTLPAATVATIKHKVLERCKKVAQASGGFVGYGAISPSEQKTLDEIAKAYEGV